MKDPNYKSFENSTEDANSSENVGRNLQPKPKNFHNVLVESIDISTKLIKCPMSQTTANYLANGQYIPLSK